MRQTPACTTAVCFLFVLLNSSISAQDSKPNIVLVMADDLAWMDLACQGNPLVDPPYLDKFAKQFLNSLYGRRIDINIG